ncbi:MAG: response regulator [Proteobacteria bacterium]|nr:response regulator [Pseudomonadota bacterium]
MSTKILVLENTEGISELLNISLSRDYDVLMAANGEDALRIIQESNPPLVIFDINVPDMDGIEFLCKVKKQSPQTEVITIAGTDCMNLGVTSLRYEASDFIMKPVTSISLEVALDRAERKIAIKKRLSPATGDMSSSMISTERVSIAKQIISSLSENQSKSPAMDTGLVSGIVSLHTRNGLILSTSDAHKKIFGNMEGKKSWGIYKRGSIKPESCPATLAFKQKISQIKDLIVFTKKGEEIEASVFAAPLINNNDQTDLVFEIITLS